MSYPWAPDETPTQIFIEESWLQGTLLSNIAYGVELTLFGMCFDLLIRQMNSTNRKRQYCLLTFITSIFMLGTIFKGANARFTQLESIEDRNYPGGPGAYGQAMFMTPDGMATSIAFVVGNWIMDGFLARSHSAFSIAGLTHTSLAGVALHGDFPGLREDLAVWADGPSLPYACCVHW